MRDERHLSALVGALVTVSSPDRVTLGLASVRETRIVRVADGWIVVGVDESAEDVMRRIDVRPTWFSTTDASSRAGITYTEAHVMTSSTDVASVTWNWVHRQPLEGFACEPRARVRRRRLTFDTIDAALAYFPDWPLGNVEVIRQRLRHLTIEGIEIWEGQPLIRIQLTEKDAWVRVHRGWLVGHIGLKGRLLRLRLPDQSAQP